MQDSTNEMEQVKKDAQESIKTFHTSQENRAYVLGKYHFKNSLSYICLRI